MIQVLRTAALMLAGMLLAAQTPTAGPILSLTATTDNVSGANESIRIDVLRWSTDAERDQLLSAWTPAAAPTKGGRGGRGGRGGAAGAAGQTPESSLTGALAKEPIVGYLWSSEVAGYSLHYAARIAGPDGGERVLLITDRRLGAWNDLWKPVGPGAATNYEFSVVELRLNSKGDGEGKTSLTGKVSVDSAAKAIVLENYGAVPVVLKNVRRRTSL
jgi:hypothetical protein